MLPSIFLLPILILLFDGRADTDVFCIIQLQWRPSIGLQKVYLHVHDLNVFCVADEETVGGCDMEHAWFGVFIFHLRDRFFRLFF